MASKLQPLQLRYSLEVSFSTTISGEFKTLAIFTVWTEAASQKTWNIHRREIESQRNMQEIIPKVIYNTQETFQRESLVL